MSGRRAVLDGATVDAVQGGRPFANAGLWLDKYLGGADEKEARRTLVDQVADLPPFEGYADAFERWRETLRALSATTDGEPIVRRCVARVRGRMVVGLGAEGVLENGIALHRTYGVPLIPGSALKGLAASYARQRLGWPVPPPPTDDARKPPPATPYGILFGDTRAAGFVTFFDAWYVPRTVPTDRPLVADVLTVHHRDYYGTGARPPADWDSPTPVPFLSATGDYLLALAGPRAWVDAAFGILELALREEGIGAKTRSGYGRMAFVAGTDEWFPLGGAPSVEPRTEPMPGSVASAMPSPADTAASEPLPASLQPPPAAAPAHEPAIARRVGMIRRFDNTSGTGLIATEGGDPPGVPFRREAFGEPLMPWPGLRVSFVLVQGARGPLARDVRAVEED